jgi:hypothetical protein
MLMHCVNKFNNCYSFSKNNKMYLNYKLKQVHINYISNCLLQSKTIIIKNLRNSLFLKFSLKISTSRLGGVVKKIGFSLKKILFEHKPKARYGHGISINILLKEFYLNINNFKTILILYDTF